MGHCASLTGQEVPDGGGLGLPPGDDGRGLVNRPAAGLQVAVHRPVALRGAAGPDKHHVSRVTSPRTASIEVHRVEGSKNL